MFRLLAFTAVLAGGLLGATPTPAQTPAEAKPTRQDAPINLMPSGNRLLIVSDDPEALKLAQELIRLLTQQTRGEGDITVIPLKHASAVETARLLDELYNGTRPASASGGRRGLNSLAGPAGEPEVSASAPRENRIRVVADPANNTLLLRATLLDLMTIRRLLETSIDAGVTESSAVRRTYVLPPLQYASASEVAHILREVYHEPAANTPGPATTGGFAGPDFPGFGSVGQNQGSAANGNGRPANSSLSIGVDDRSNRLVLVCSEKMKDEVQRVVDQLDHAAKTATRTVRVIPVKGVDPLLIQQAIDAIQGRNRSAARSNNGSLADYMPTRFGPSGWNGFLPGVPGTGGTLPGGSPAPAGGAGNSGQQ